MRELLPVLATSLLLGCGTRQLVDSEGIVKSEQLFSLDDCVYERTQYDYGNVVSSDIEKLITIRLTSTDSACLHPRSLNEVTAEYLKDGLEEVSIIYNLSTFVTQRCGVGGNQYPECPPEMSNFAEELLSVKNFTHHKHWSKEYARSLNKE